MNIVLSVGVSFLLSLFLTPLMIFIAKKKNIMDIPTSRKTHTEPVPLLGGVAIFLASTISCVLFPRSVANYVLPILIVGAACISIMGLIDDILSLSAKRRLVILFIVALIVVFGCLQFYFNAQHLIRGSVISVLVFSVFILVWIVGVTNAINFSDGLDGLASYLSAISALSFAIIFAYQGRDMFALPMALALFGAIAGFIPYNRNPAMIFMGDTGSMFIGFMLSLLAISSLRHEHTLYAMVVPIYLLLVPLMDMGMSILRRMVLRKPIMKPDKNHFHHQLYKLLSSNIAVVIILSVIQIISSAIGILVFISKEFILGWIVLIIAILIVSAFTIITSLKAARKEEAG